MKKIANILTASRIALAIFLLLFFKKISVLFLIIYTVAEFTDMIDGTIARKTNSCSQFGALLDSVADLLLNASLLKVVFSLRLIGKRLSVWLILALGIGTISPIINFIKHKKVFFIHSIPCKIIGGLLLIIPYAIYFNFFNAFLVFMLAILTPAMVEIVIMSIILDVPDPNAKSIYSLLKSRRQISI
jgi:CDP-diacylglycerol--glycerol-3-phosphate 3-phosphatidyltransferase